MSITRFRAAAYDLGINVEKLQALTAEGVNLNLPIPPIEDSIAATAGDLAADFNALLQALRDAGIIEEAPES